eukprot:m.41009 g.41009  ORF g.41009 m.41009 type:complete len:889 (+) comp11422_c0_seq2:841-3507(+)
MSLCRSVAAAAQRAGSRWVSVAGVVSQARPMTTTAAGSRRVGVAAGVSVPGSQPKVFTGRASRSTAAAAAAAAPDDYGSSHDTEAIRDHGTAEPQGPGPNGGSSGRKRQEPSIPSRNRWWGFDAGSDMDTLAAHQDGPVDLAWLREQRADEVASLSEVVQHERFCAAIESGNIQAPASPHTLASVGMTRQQCHLALLSGITTQILHTESRVTSLLGQGYYTIGPGGEELLGIVGCLLEQKDSVALHYRHLATQVARQLSQGKPIREILTNRARGHVVSSLDPVTGGVHCALGGGDNDYVVTSTLASQAPPAVGRALGAPLAHKLKLKTPFPKNSVSYVSVGDGSVNNAHFLAAANTAEYAAFRGYRCPVVFAISDNDLCISLKGFGWLGREFKQKLRMRVFEADGRDMLDVWDKTNKALTMCRKETKPVTLIFKNLTRRFGHAATDRQDAYLTQDQIQAAADRNPLLGACAQAVETGVTTYDELQELTNDITNWTRQAFQDAACEPKNNDRQVMLQRVAAAEVEVARADGKGTTAKGRVLDAPKAFDGSPAVAGKKRENPTIMRKHMNRVLDELLTDNQDLVYIGEDVTHGGYYVITDGLAKKHPLRVCDFPPDETTLLGAGIGYSQAGLLPVVEIPYAKYLDCGYDMLGELAISNWLSNGRHPAGLIIRLQGFGVGVFGGNFHTHNSLHLPPGLDVVCYSNGADYAKGWRNIVAQARAGRAVMSVDCTQLLAQRHLFEGDDAWRRPYPERSEVLGFGDVVKYGDGEGKDLCLVAYGTGVLNALRVRDDLLEQFPSLDVAVIDSPYLSSAKDGLREAVSDKSRVLFVDTCKQGQHPLAGIITQLQSERLLPSAWQCVAALPTYNPLGQTLTFVSDDDVRSRALQLLEA